jgi:hypothetical protein
MITITIEKGEVDINDNKLTWGQREIIRNTFFDIAKETITPESTVSARIKRVEYAVKEIRENGVKHGFSKEWFFDLSVEDGDKIMSVINEIDLKKNIPSAEPK